MLMKTTLFAALGAVALAAPSLAQDVAEGEKQFGKCKACHMIVAPDGTEIVKGAKTGPNLYGVIGRVAGSLEGFKYGAGIEELTAKGYVWTEADLAVYVQDPTKFLVEKTGDKKAKSKMMFKLKKEEDAKNVAAFLASLAPAPDAAATDAAATDAAAPAEGAVTE